MSKYIISEEELIKRYLLYLTLDDEAKRDMRNKLYYTARRRYGSWQNFKKAAEKFAPNIKKEKRVPSERMRLLCATLQIAHRTGKKVDALNCINAVRKGYADNIRIV